MRRMRSITMLVASTLLMAMSCSAEEPQAKQPSGSVTSGETRTLIAYFSAQGHTRAVAEAIRHETGADIYSIEPGVPRQIHTMIRTRYRTRHTMTCVPP